MKILHVYKNYYPVMGGIENYARILCTEFARRGHDVTALVANDQTRTVREVIDGVQVIRAGALLTAARTPLSVQLFRELARCHPDITHLHFPYPIGELAQLFAGKRRTVITYHSDIVKQRTLLRLYDPFLRRTLARADRIIAASPNYVQSSPYLRRVAEKCRIVPYGVDGARFAHPEPLAVTALRQKYGEPLVLFVGLFRYYKGLTYLVEAMRDVPAHLVLVGAGPLDGELREQVRRDRLDDKVHFAGVVADNDLPSFYHACDVFVLPSSQRSEAFGISQIEAMCCAKPIVCTELGTGTSFVNVDGETGFVVPPRDPLALAAALTKLLTDNELRGRMGHAARRRAAEQFSKEDMIERTEAVYREVLERG